MTGVIITLTANPSVDRTVDLGAALRRGAVQRALAVRTQAGGKGVNISRAAQQSGVPTVAVLPAADADPFVVELHADRIPCRPVAAGPVRINLTLTEPDGTTTKVNTPGSPVDADVLSGLVEALHDEVDRAASAGPVWVVAAGSLPPGAPEGWYAEVAAGLRASGAEGPGGPGPVRVAVDTSDAPLSALGARLDTAAPDLVKPNGHELADLLTALGEPGEWVAEELEADPLAAAAAAARLIDRGVGSVLATLGAGGAVLVTREAEGVRAWHATPPPTTVRSTVGAGDSSLFGFLYADLDGADPPRRLATAVAWGSAAAALPGTTIPHPDQASSELVTVRELALAAPTGGTA